MRSILGKTFWGLSLLGMAGAFLWYALFTARIGVDDRHFLTKHDSAGLLADAWLLRGDLNYYEYLDASAGARCYREAVRRNPLLVDAWLALAEAEIAQGHAEESKRILTDLAPVLSEVSTWKWKEFQLAGEIHDEQYFSECLNFILTRVPHRAQEACNIALNFWGSWEETFLHLLPESHRPFLVELIKAREVEAASVLWDKMVQSSLTTDGETTLLFCEFLMGNEMIPKAKDVWKVWNGAEGQGVYDGGFEEEPLQKGFGWRFIKQSDVTVERSSQSPHSGDHCLHLRFHGNKNVSFFHALQVVPVEPEQEYRLKFVQKSRNLTTDQGVSVQVKGYGCDGLWARSEPLKGSSSWTNGELQFTVPNTCEAVILRVVRKESLRFDNKISGDYWLDAVELERLDTTEGETPS